MIARDSSIHDIRQRAAADYRLPNRDEAFARARADVKLLLDMIGVERARLQRYEFATLTVSFSDRRACFENLTDGEVIAYSYSSSYYAVLVVLGNQGWVIRHVDDLAPRESEPLPFLWLQRETKMPLPATVEAAEAIKRDMEVRCIRCRLDPKIVGVVPDKYPDPEG